jgi:peptidoglycan/LPS O-acetylase OafA/YrhL
MSNLGVQKARIAGLDGLRAFSIALVLLAHLIGTRNFDPPPILVRALELFHLGPLGVRIFFVISGFLITSLLIEEEARTGTISLRRFYFRRTLRIFPPYYLFILVIVLLEWRGLLSLQSGDVGHALTYTTNYHRDRSWHIGHAWSLAVEEQFYILWPFLYRTLRQAKAARLLTIYILFAPLWRLTVAFVLPSQRLAIGESFLTTADAIACGCWLALQRERLTACAGYRRFIDSRWYVLLIPALLASNALERFTKLDWAVLITVQNVLIALIVERVTRTSSGWTARILSARPVVLLGLWSYSVYLWQQLVLDRADQISWATAFPVNLGACLLLAMTSYYLVERPALRLRQRLEARLFPKPARIEPRAIVLSETPP